MAGGNKQFLHKDLSLPHALEGVKRLVSLPQLRTLPDGLSPILESLRIGRLASLEGNDRYEGFIRMDE